MAIQTHIHQVHISVYAEMTTIVFPFTGETFGSVLPKFSSDGNAGEPVGVKLQLPALP